MYFSLLSQINKSFGIEQARSLKKGIPGLESVKKNPLYSYQQPESIFLKVHGMGYFEVIKNLFYHELLIVLALTSRSDKCLNGFKLLSFKLGKYLLNK